MFVLSFEDGVTTSALSTGLRMWFDDPGNFLGIRSENAAWANENTPVEGFSMSSFLMTGRCPYGRATTMKVGGFGPFWRSKIA
jgi:hypothetical protein